MGDLFDVDFSNEQLLSRQNYSMSRHNSTLDSVQFPAGFVGGLAGGGTMVVVAGLFDRFVAPVVVIVGLLSNLVALFVFSERSMQRRSSSVYLAAISVAGIGFLACVMLSWTAHTSIDVYLLDGACKTLTYVTYVSSFLGVWYVVGFTVERFVAVHYPLRRLSLCTAVKARRTVIGLAAFACAAYGYGAWTSGVTELWPGGGRICAPLRRYAAALSAVHVVDTFLTLLLPFVIISLLNVRIVVTVFRQNRARQAIATHFPPPRPAVRRCSPVALGRGHERLPLHRYVRDHVGRRRSRYDQFRVTKLLLTVSLAFLALNLPRHATRAYALILSSDRHHRPSLTLLACEKLFNVVYYAHFAVNIVLYATLGGKKFRSALLRRYRAFCRCAAD